MAVKINTLELENVKRIKAVKIEPTSSGLTVIGGKNNQGKTSVLDSIAWALGGNKFRPAEAEREGSVIPPHLKITLDNGVIVERSGKNGSLKVTDPAGNKSGQQLLDSFIGQLALDLPRFLGMTEKEKANVLLQIIGVGDKLAKLDITEQQLYNQRTAVGRIADQKKKHANEMPIYSGVPSEPVSVSELIKQQQDILAKNGENQRKREQVDIITKRANDLSEEIQRLKKQMEERSKELTKTLADLETARKSTSYLHDESTAELEENIRNIETINQRVRVNLEREKAEMDAEIYQQEYNALTAQIESVRCSRQELLSNADLPLPELTVTDGKLIYKGHSWNNMSGSEQLKVATAIVRKLNPQCGFVLLDKLEQMDIDTLAEFGEWLESEGLQAIATRVSVGDECSVIIEDGYITEVKSTETKKWKVGEF